MISILIYLLIICILCALAWWIVTQFRFLRRFRRSLLL